MTDPSSDSRRRRRRSGRHQQQTRRPQSPPVPPDEARRNRDAAFGSPTPKRTWISAASAASPSSSDPAGPSAQESTTPSSAEPATTPLPAGPAEPREAEPPTARLSPIEDEQPAELPGRRRGRRAAFPLEQLDPSPSTGAADGEAAAPAAGAAEAPAGAAAARAVGETAGEADDAAARYSGRRRAALPAEPPTEQDVWSSATDDAGPTGPTGPAGPARPAEPTGSTGPTVVPGRSTSASRPAVASAAASDSVPSRTSPAASAEDTGSGTGSLPRVAFWTVLTSVLPGSGLVTTRMHRIGWALLAVLLLALVTGAAFLLFGEPLRTGALLASRRGVLIGAMIAVGVGGIVWALQIVLANLAHSTRERLAGAKRYLALALAALMVVAVVVPVGRGVQSLWALQGLMGSTSVFGGGLGGDHPFTSGDDPWANTDRVNIMLLGQDAGADRTGTRPDTIMVASIDTATGRTALFSIPRNLEDVEFPEGTVAEEAFPNGFDYFGQDQNLINAVWTWAEDRPDLFPNDPEPGLTATRWAVEETLGLEMDYYTMVNLRGFEDLVDALGGVEMVVERRIPIGGGASEIEGYIEPGEQTLDGFHALWYARSREGSNDFNRMCRQQRIVRAVTEEADPTTLALSVPRLVSATEENIVTNIPVSNLDAFVDLALRVKDGGFTSYPITPDVTYSGDPDYEYIEEWVDASIADSLTQEAPESVLGETEPGSTDPAETGAPPEEESDAQEPGAADSPTAEETPSEEPGTGAGTPTEEESSTPGTGGTSTPAPEIEKDPLKSCLPGYEG